MAIFAERPVIPKEIHYEIVELGGQKIEQEDRVGKEGSVRSVSAVLHFDINTAFALKNWLDDKIDQFRNAHPEIEIPKKEQT